MAIFTLLGLDADMAIIQIVRFTNLQWNRKYHEVGDFTLQLSLDQYNPDVKYLYTKDRPELGIVQKRTYVTNKGKSYIQLQGVFFEHELSRMICYPKGTTNITNQPNWEFQEGPAETVAYAFFNGFKQLSTSTVSVDLGITAEETEGRGEEAVHYRNSEDLSYKIYDILKPSGMSYRVLYDLDDNVKTFEVWQGKDRKSQNTAGNNPIVFSTKYGNISNLNLLIDDGEYRNGCIVVHETSENDVQVFNVRAVFNEDEDPKVLMTQRSSLNKSEYTASEFLEALDNEGKNALAQTLKITNLEYDTLLGSYEYMVDFDLGDICTIEVPEMNVAINARLIGCYEVIKKNGWTMTMEFGEPITQA